MTKESLSYKFTRYFIESPLTLLILATIFVLGIIALLKLPREEEPQISVPMVDIFLQADGLKAEDAVELVTKPLEVIIKGIPDVEHVYSQTEDNKAIVTARFNVGSSYDNAVLRIHEKIRAHLFEIPYGIPMPIIAGKSIDDVGIVVLTLFPNQRVAHRWNDTSLFELAQKLQKELIKIEDVGSTYIVGGRPEQIRIEPNLEKLQLYKISLNEVIEKVRASNATQSVNIIRHQHQSILISSGKNIQSITDLGLLMITNRDGKDVYLKDIATITNAGKPLEAQAWHWNKNDQTMLPSVSVVVAKKPGANAINISHDIIKRLETIKGSLLPHDIECEITRDYGKTANEKSNRLLEDLLGATLSVILLITVALGWREGVVVLFVIPATILGTLFIAWIFGFTINRVSLFALIFSIGILVDDAIVFIENIVRHWKENPSANRVTTAIEAVVEVGNPTIMATLTIIVALLPMLFVSGLMGPYMSPIPINASVAMLLSLFVAFALAPWLLLKFEKGITHHVTHNKENFLSKTYKIFVIPLLNDRSRCKKFLIFTATLTVLSFGLFLTKSVVVKMLPFDNKSEIVIQVDLKEGSTLEETDRTLRILAKSLNDLPELMNMQLYVGQGAPFNFNGLVRHSYLRQKPELGEIQLNFLPKNERKRESHAIALDIRNRVDTLNLSNTTTVKVLEVPPGPPVLSTLLAEVYGPTPSIRRDVVKALKDIFKSIDFIKDIDDSMGEQAPKMTLVIEQEKLNHYKVEEKAVYSAISAVLSSNRVGYSYRGDGKYPIDMTIELPQSEKAMNERILSTLVLGKNGLVELGDLVKITFEKTSHSIFRHNGYDADLVMAELAGDYEAPLYGMLAVNKAIDSYDWKDLPKPKISFHGQPQNELYPTILWDGEWEITYVTFRDMGAAFILAIFGIYALLVAQFKSYRTPIVILMPIPLVLVGIIVGHWMLHASFTATSMIGLIALAGIVVRNSLLLVEFIKHRLESGDTLVDALIKAGSTRITPIFLTAAAAMIGAIFMFFDPIFQGLAISLFFGLMSSTLLTLFAIPALYIVAKTKRSIR